MRSLKTIRHSLNSGNQILFEKMPCCSVVGMVNIIFAISSERPEITSSVAGQRSCSQCIPGHHSPKKSGNGGGGENAEGWTRLDGGKEKQNQLTARVAQSKINSFITKDQMR